jgi:hypothetical protein
MMDKGDNYSKVHKAYLTITEEWETFKKNCARKEDKDLRQWGLDIRCMNIGSLTLGSRGYDCKSLRWEKEDPDPLMGGKIKPWAEFEDRRQPCVYQGSVPSRRKHWRICNIRDDGAINC